MDTTTRSANRRLGRPPGSPPNRAAILAAARQQFGERGYDGATIRGIAAAAGVDPALVHHYFGTKDDLMLAALQPVDLEGLTDLIADGPEGLGERFLRVTLVAYETGNPVGWKPLVGLLRSAPTHPDAARVLRETFARAGIASLVEALDVPQPRLRAALVATELAGLAMARYVVRLEPLASADPEALVAWYAPTLQRYLTGPLPGDDA